nr:hypothetical protein [Haliscomenobacter sp.]
MQKPSNSITVHPDIQRAETLPAEFYRNPAVFEAMRDSLFPAVGSGLKPEKTWSKTEPFFPFKLYPALSTSPFFYARTMKGRCSVSAMCVPTGAIFWYTTPECTKNWCATTTDGVLT